MPDDTDNATSEEIDKKITHYMDLLESELGQDIVPIVIIITCRVAIKYSLNIDWVLHTIFMGYQNEVPPDIVVERGKIKYDS